MERALRATLRDGKFLTSAKRSRVMAAVRSRGNKTTELAVRMVLVRAGIRGWRMHGAGLPGCPDFVFDGRGAVIFVHGCFWHGHVACRDGRVPQSNRAYWSLKLSRNVARDAQNVASLARLGWRVLTIWECEIRDEGTAHQLRLFLGL
jgi:DNA mismatch endonuclease, patch repair protein